MKKTIIALMLFVAAAVAYSCTTKEEPMSVDQIASTTTAVIEDFILDGPDTKTVVHFNGDNNPSFTFTSDDILGVYPTSPEVGDQQRFTVETIEGTTATFKGNGFALKPDEKYAAYYPAVYPADVDAIPLDYTGQVQPGKTTFGIAKADYLVAKGIKPVNGECTFSMQHLGALVVMDVTFPDAGTYTELSLTTSTGAFTTAATLDLTAPAQMSGVTVDESAATVSLALGENGAGITVSRKETVRFCLMVAPKDLSAATLTVTLKDSNNQTITKDVPGKDFTKGKAYKYTCAFDPAPFTEPTNLGAIETANTYIVDVDDVNPEGYYFTTTVAGNGAGLGAAFAEFGYSAAAWPSNGNAALIAASTATVIWNGYPNSDPVISDVTYNSTDKTISFKATGKKGCAKVCANVNNINFWTWLIWCTDQPSEITFTNSTNGVTFTALDRNLGAITTVVDPSNLNACAGLYYQWGNPVPWVPSEFNAATTANAQGNLSMTGALWAPTLPHLWDRYWTTDWFDYNDATNGGQMYAILWGGGGKGCEWIGKYEYGVKTGHNTVKTMYDPCPPGYKVAPNDFLDGYTHTSNFTELSADATGMYLQGTDGVLFFPYNGVAWSGAAGYNGFIDWAPGPQIRNDEADNKCYISLWTASHYNKGMSYCYYFAHRSETAIGGDPLVAEAGASRGHGVRCIAE